MDIKRITDIISLTNDFYKANSVDFARTRGSEWPGWNKLLPFINAVETPKVLDIGCGNGRFYDFLKSHYKKSLNYIGLDSNDYLLEKAADKHKDATFIKQDVLKDLDLEQNTFNIVTIFGLMHHIPGNEFRQAWIKSVSKLLTKNGYLIFTIWQLDQDPRFSKLQKITDMEENDYFYGWDKTDTQRYVHIYSQDEEKELIEGLPTMKLIDSYVADGKSNRLNKYFIFRLL